MNNRARNELIGVIVGLAMIITGVCLFISKTSITSTFLEVKGIWKWWSILLVFLPLLTGIILSAVKPQHIVPKIIALVGAVLLIVVIMVNSTIIIEEKISPFEWILCGVLALGGLFICFVSLFAKKKK